MKLTKISSLTGVAHTLDIPNLEEEGYYKYVENPHPPYIQDAFPHLNEDEREFILSGITKEEWDEAFDELY